MGTGVYRSHKGKDVVGGASQTIGRRRVPSSQLSKKGKPRDPRPSVNSSQPIILKMPRQSCYYKDLYIFNVIKYPKN